MTSVALTKVLFEKWLGGGREFAPMPPRPRKMLAQHDAGLVIGDPALQIDRSRYYTLDLAEDGFATPASLSSLPSGRCKKGPCAKPHRCRISRMCFNAPAIMDWEPANLDHIAREWAPRLGLTRVDVRAYLTGNIHYQLDAACMEGLKLFYRYAAEIGALPPHPRCVFSNATSVAVV